MQDFGRQLPFGINFHLVNNPSGFPKNTLIEKLFYRKIFMYLCLTIAIGTHILGPATATRMNTSSYKSREHIRQILAQYFISGWLWYYTGLCIVVIQTRLSLF